MMLRSSLKFLVSSAFVVLLASCSNNPQPVSVDSGADNRTTAAIADLSIRDMGWGGGPWGTGHLWAVTKQATGSNYYLAKYNFSTGAWSVKTYSGLRCAVSTNNTCYYVNAAGQIKYVKSSGATGSINTPVRSSGGTKALDIGAGSNDPTSDNLIAVCQSIASGNKYLYYGLFLGSGTVEWIEFTGSGSPSKTAMDPDNGGETAMCNSSGEVWLGEPETSWLVPGSTGFTDVGACQRYCVGIKNSKLYVNKVIGEPLIATTITAKAVGMTTLNGIIEVLFVNSNDKLEYWPLSSF